ncbi:MAG: YciK family oxidoreductase [Pseudomonadota bacterium]
MPSYTAPADLLSGRVVLVTGAGDGIGRAASLAYARVGAQVILLGRRIGKLEGVYDEIENAGGPTPAIYPLDLEGANADHYAELARRVEQEMGRLDGILHNAAELGVLCPLELYPPHIWAQAMMVNLNAPFLLTQACLPLLKKSPDAALIFTGDDVGRHGKAYWGAYGIGKAAIENMAQILADELENTPVRVNVINPGPTRTGMRVKAYPGLNPLEVPTADQIMPLYLYLMGPDSRELRGQSLNARDWMRP